MFGGPGGPTHMVSAEGARVHTADGRVLLDWTMSLGAVSLGYAHPHVVEAVAKAARDGITGPLPPLLEGQVAERLVAGYPGAERARFFKTGAEAVQAAVRLARVHTGRETVVHCGYHGWLDGPTSGAGVPPGASAAWHGVEFNAVAAIEEACARLHPAAIVLEPVIERAPDPAWLAAARRQAETHGAVLVYDEIKTAFRLARGGAAEAYGIAPDLAIVGKAFGNGAPIAAVVGRAGIMDRVKDTWISSTLATESLSLAAAAAVLDVWDREDVAGHIRRTGAAMLAGMPRGPWDVVGMPQMWFLRFADADAERRFLLACVERAVLLKRGAYNFPSLAHGEAEVELTLDAMRGAAREVGA